MIHLKNITHAFTKNTPLFEDFSYSFKRGEKVAFVGNNGTGKSTLLRIITQALEPDDGDVIYDTKLRIASVAQEGHYGENELISQIFSAALRNRDFSRSISQLGCEITPESSTWSTHTWGELSGGQQKILMLANALAEKPDVLVVDEPENHLDLYARQKLIDLFVEFSGVLLVVSHDIHLVDTVCKTIIGIKNGSITVGHGMKYEAFYALYEKNAARERELWNAERKDLAKLEDAVRILHKQAFRGTNTAGYQSRKRELEKRKSELGDRPDFREATIRLAPKDDEKTENKKVIEFNDVRFQFPDKEKALFGGVSFTIYAHDRVGILGKNGAGKSTFISLVMNERAPSYGTIQFSYKEKPELFRQTNITIDENQNSYDLFGELKKSETEIRRILAQFLITGKEVYTPFKNLSGGQKARVRFALLFESSPRFIILDEPTNNLDPLTWQILVDYIKAYTGCLWVISHDYAFLSAIELTSFLVVHNKQIELVYRTLDEAIEMIYD